MAVLGSGTYRRYDQRWIHQKPAGQRRFALNRWNLEGRPNAWSDLQRKQSTITSDKVGGELTPASHDFRRSLHTFFLAPSKHNGGAVVGQGWWALFDAALQLIKCLPGPSNKAGIQRWKIGAGQKNGQRRKREEGLGRTKCPSGGMSSSWPPPQRPGARTAGVGSDVGCHEQLDKTVQRWLSPEPLQFLFDYSDRMSLSPTQY
ncbi:hypothetical protein B0H63DRAFT_273097 [Podospora didyma]|uniref:Uncharacterized protein n=1 Tax=Podospora didyma TaxID=330526 RepID=A0AAE0KFH9_9PEZI|nr:hypothetical protein B0H63DRAFT_273097 [Podospora didyma]